MKPIAGMDKTRSKAVSLYLKNEREWHAEETDEEQARRDRSLTVLYDGPYFALIPQDLLRDPEMPHAAVRLWALYHSYSQNTKDLRHRPATFVGQEVLSHDMGIDRHQITRHTRVLEQNGWLDSVRRGLGKTNLIVLRGRKRG
jgi:hypothetical protein